ncbi:MAG TPA: hypothetical protein VE291_12725 [Terracidiphilus sp.]|jgi:hypothetical protein|nr:hypothetical protein [Terracidiphilus sp.]
MRIVKFKVAVLLILCLIVAGFAARRTEVVPVHAAQDQQSSSQEKAKPGFALLPESEIGTYNHYYRSAPTSNAESWEPTVSDMNAAEANLTQISALSDKYLNAGRHIDNPRQYFRQYLAIVQDGKRMIFVNAFCELEESETNGWRKHLRFVYDGGKCFWRAFYDPSTQKFSNLTVNGYA